MVIDEVAVQLNCYYFIREFSHRTEGEIFNQVMYFSPFDGRELEGALKWQVQEEFFQKLHRSTRTDEELSDIIKSKNLLNQDFDFRQLPLPLKKLLESRQWFDLYLHRQRQMHTNNHDKLCEGLSAFISCRYGEKKLPKLSQVSIEYCPFCGTKLPSEFQKEDWWSKEFKTFNWDKKCADLCSY